MADHKTALVLSAGGMFGAYQAGVWSALSEHVSIDLIVGASVGAMNGWLIAGGCPAERLEQAWLDPSAGDALSPRQNRNWRSWRKGYFDPAMLSAAADRLQRECSPRIPFGLVLVQLPGLKRVLIQHPDIRPVHLQATCSIPFALPAVAIDGHRYIDGGVLEKLPLWAALQLGATRIIAIDALPEVGPRWVRAGVRLFRLFRSMRPTQIPSGIDLTIISPSGYLGTIADAVTWKRENIERWLEMGRRDGMRALRDHADKAA